MTDRTVRLGGLALSRATHDRASDRRLDDAWLDQRWASAETRVLVVADGRTPVNESGDALVFVEPEQAPPGDRLFLGCVDGRAYFAVLAQRLPGDTPAAGLREIGAAVGDRDAGLAVHAQALANWHATHPRCSVCGAATRVAAGGHVRECPECGATHFPRTDPAVIMLVTDADDRCLLGHQPRWPDGRFSTLAGFVEPGESLEQAVRREVREEVGIEVGEVSYAGSQPWPFPSSLMLGFFGHAESTAIEVDGDEISAARWFSRDEVRDAAERGVVIMPGRISIARRLIETWYGGPLPGSW